MLAESGLVSGAALQRARRLEAESGERIDRIAAKLGLVSERDLAAAYAQLIGSPVLDPTDFPDEPVAAGRIGRAFLKQPRMIPLVESEDALVVRWPIRSTTRRRSLAMLRVLVERPGDIL